MIEKPSLTDHIKTNALLPKSRIILFIGIILAVLFLYLALRQVSGTEILQTLTQIRLEYIVFAFLMNTLALFFRGLRWGVLISAQKKVGPIQMFLATAIGYVGNTFLPARAGEILRSYVLGVMTGISASYVFATALTERIMDVISLVIIGSLVIFTISAAVPPWLPTTLQWMAAAGLVGLVLFILVPRFENILQIILSKMNLQKNWNTRISAFITQFILGTQSFINMGRAAAFVLLTALIWIMDAVGTVVFVHGLNLNIQFGQALLLLAAMGLSSALPSTPGYVGIYQFVAVSVMPIFGITPSQALVYILAVQAINVSTVVIWGLVGFWRFGIKPQTIMVSSR